VTDSLPSWFYEPIEISQPCSASEWLEAAATAQRRIEEYLVIHPEHRSLVAAEAIRSV
jgi:hypothetical protein